MENLEIYPELDDRIIEMMDLAEEEMKVKQTVYETQRGLPTSSKRVLMEDTENQSQLLELTYEESSFWINIFNGPVTFNGNVSFECRPMQRNRQKYF